MLIRIVNSVDHSDCYKNSHCGLQGKKNDYL